jgi:Flp pilus assembly protein TadG
MFVNVRSMRRSSDDTGDPRRGAAMVELAICLPLLLFLLVITADWARVYYYSQMLANCARQGALWASDPVAQSESLGQSPPITTVTQAALAEPGSGFAWPGQPPTVTSSGIDPVTVQVSWTFNAITPSFQLGPFAFTNQLTLTRSATMRLAP